jgi:hypothetical protein
VAYTIPFTLTTAAFLGAYSGLLLLALVGFARSVDATLHPGITLSLDSLEQSLQISMPLQPPFLGSAIVTLAAAAPLAALLLWVRPFAAGLLGLAADDRTALQAMSLILCGARPTSSCALQQ